MSDLTQQGGAVSAVEGTAKVDLEPSMQLTDPTLLALQAMFPGADEPPQPSVLNPDQLPQGSE